MASVVGFIVRMVVYVAVVAGSSAVLYGIVKSQNQFSPDSKDMFDGSSCFLFGKWYTPPGSSDGMQFAGGDNGWCKFVEFAAASQLGLAVLMAIVSVVRLIPRGRDGNKASFSSMVELFFVIPAFIVAVAGASIMSAGLAIACSRLLGKDWDKSLYKKEDSWDKPSSCSSAKIIFKDGDNYPYQKFYNNLNIAQIGMWVTCLWLFHVLLSMMAVRTWLRKSRGTEDAAFTNSERYKKMTELM